ALGLLVPRIGLKAFWLWQTSIVLANLVNPDLSVGTRGHAFFGLYNLGFGVGGLIAMAVRARLFVPGIATTSMTFGGCLLFTFFILDWLLGAKAAHDSVPLGDHASPLLYMTACGLLIYGAVQYVPDLGVKSRRVVSLLGDSSYVLYLFHGLF